MKTYDVIIVGAGAAGIGAGAVLKDLGINNMIIVDKYEVGASFKKWPKQTKLITPSFPGNSFEMMDLNSIAINTSPGYSLQNEHPSGKEYAQYLNAVVRYCGLSIKTGVDVKNIMYKRGYFEFENMKAKYLIWAVGEYATPNLLPFTGAKFCTHYSRVKDWKMIKGKKVIVIGGYESGADAALHLSDLGHQVILLERHHIFNEETSDPSRALSPYTIERLKNEMKNNRIVIDNNKEVVNVEKSLHKYIIHCKDESQYESDDKPILCTGFLSGAGQIKDFWDWRDDGMPKLNQYDESTKTTNLFLVGPSVRQDKHIFCFIYKFRQRFPIVAGEIAKRMKVDPSPLEIYKKHNMYLEDLSCCGEECAC